MSIPLRTCRPAGALILACSAWLATACASAEPAPEDPDGAAADAGADASPTADAAPPLACNGSPLLCDRRLDQVAFATAHNAFNNDAEGWLVPNQTHGLRKQLQDGVRGFMLDAWPYDGDDPQLQGKTTLCHGPCVLGAEWLRDGLAKLHDFLHEDPGAVLVIVFENHVGEAALEAELLASGLLDHVHAHLPGQPWATLGELVASDERVVVLTELGPARAPWNHAYLQVAFDTPFTVKTAEAFGCEVLRGSPDNDLFVLNHFLTNPVGSLKLAQQANASPVLRDHVLQCQVERAHLPNLVAVDFYEVGELRAVVDELNGL